MLAAILGLGGCFFSSRALAQSVEADVSGIEILTRGPVHEAFAGIVTFNPEPGIVVAATPPDIIEEVPPNVMPEGDDVAWIPGYWAWDDERTDFLWVSGVWRALPPGRAWVPGYWGETTQGYQWISGYWSDTAEKEMVYLPPPPATMEEGANVAAPADDYGWTPGSWVWAENRYVWRAGYWLQGRPDWTWIPSQFVWSPRGYIFVGGYWDYSVERRGVIFAPVHFNADVYARRGYRYTPTIAISISVFADHLFLRPSYHHYYFGDYYAADYAQEGFYPSYSYQSRREGYDPIFSHQRWARREDRVWESQAEESFLYRRAHDTARPPRTWVAQRNLASAVTGPMQSAMMVAAPMDQLAKRESRYLRLQSVPEAQKGRLARAGQEVQESREQRRALEVKVPGGARAKSGSLAVSSAAPSYAIPIVAKPENLAGRKLAVPKAVRESKKSDQLSVVPPSRRGDEKVKQPAELRKTPGAKKGASVPKTVSPRPTADRKTKAEPRQIEQKRQSREAVSAPVQKTPPEKWPAAKSEAKSEVRHPVTAEQPASVRSKAVAAPRAVKPETARRTVQPPKKERVVALAPQQQVQRKAVQADRPAAGDAAIKAKKKVASPRPEPRANTVPVDRKKAQPQVAPTNDAGEEKAKTERKKDVKKSRSPPTSATAPTMP